MFPQTQRFAAAADGLHHHYDDVIHPQLQIVGSGDVTIPTAAASLQGRRKRIIFGGAKRNNIFIVTDRKRNKMIIISLLLKL